MQTKSYYNSPFGRLVLISENNHLLHLAFHDEWPDIAIGEEKVLTQTRNELDEYFAGKRQKFNVPIHLAGTPFQLRVWQELQTIPFGEKISYQALAEKAARPNACRAAGTANKGNPIAIIVPCHRVIQKSGAIGGYYGEPYRKDFLLRHEAKVCS